MKVLVTGAAGFIGHHLCRRLKATSHVYGVDIQKHAWHDDTDYDEFALVDCRDRFSVSRLFSIVQPDIVYALAADMGGAGYVFTGENDYNILCNNLLINIATAEAAKAKPPQRLLFTSSACVYPEHLQLSPSSQPLAEDVAYPASPDSEYGWEKLMAERLYLALAKETDIRVRIARFHNIYGPGGSWNDGREKLPAAACRKVATGDPIIDVWGDGQQRRSFCYIDDCLEMLTRLMESDYLAPMNIGTSTSVSVDELYDIVASIAGRSIEKVHDLSKPQGVRGRNADLTLMRKVLGYEPRVSLQEGLRSTYMWIAGEAGHET